EAAMNWVHLLQQALRRLGQQLRLDRHLLRLDTLRQLDAHGVLPLVELAELLGLPLDLLSPRPAEIGDAGQHTREACHAIAVLWREVGASVEGSAVRREDPRHRPPPAASQRLHRVHVERVNVRPLLPIHLDADEMLAHQPRDVLILEALGELSVAPMTSTVSYAQ